MDDMDTLAHKLSIPADVLVQFFKMLLETELIGLDSDSFSIPERPTSPQSLNFWIHTTNACNLGCSYCYIPTLNTSGGMTHAVRQQLLLKLLETVKAKGVRHIRLRLAGGEPLGQFGVWKEFIPEAKMLLAEAGCKLDAGFVTNLTLLTDEMIGFAKEHSIGFGVSLDGIQSAHDATRSFRSGCGSFNLVDTNLRKLIAAGINVSVTTVVTNLNLTGLPELTRYLINLDIPFRYSLVKGSSIHAELLDEYLTESYDAMQEAIENGWKLSKRFQFCDLKPNELSHQTCASGFSGGAIYTDGSFKYCQVQFENSGKAVHTIFDDDLDLVDMIVAGEHHEDNRSEDCKKCRYRSICTSGCPVYRKDGKDPQCSLYHRFIPKYFELQARERLA